MTLPISMGSDITPKTLRRQSTTPLPTPASPIRLPSGLFLDDSDLGTSPSSSKSPSSPTRYSFRSPLPMRKKLENQDFFPIEEDDTDKELGVHKTDTDPDTAHVYVVLQDVLPQQQSSAPTRQSPEEEVSLLENNPENDDYLEIESSDSVDESDRVFSLSVMTAHEKRGIEISRKSYRDETAPIVKAIHAVAESLPWATWHIDDTARTQALEHLTIVVMKQGASLSYYDVSQHVLYVDEALVGEATFLRKLEIGRELLHALHRGDMKKLSIEEMAQFELNTYKMMLSFLLSQYQEGDLNFLQRFRLVDLLLEREEAFKEGFWNYKTFLENIISGLHSSSLFVPTNPISSIHNISKADAEKKLLAFVLAARNA